MISVLLSIYLQLLGEGEGRGHTCACAITKNFFKYFFLFSFYYVCVFSTLYLLYMYVI